MTDQNIRWLCIILFCSTFVLGCGISKYDTESVTLKKVNEFKNPKVSIVQKLVGDTTSSIADRIGLYYKLKKDSSDLYEFGNENEMLSYGYYLLEGSKLNEATEIFKLAVSEFPDAWNTYDCLGEAYLKNGNTELALFNYQKSLSLNARNFNAEDQIELIQHPEKALEKPSDKFVKVYTKNQYIEDLEQLAKDLTTIHPNVFKFTSKNEFWKIVEEKKAQITDNTTYSQFTWHCSEIISSVHCSHTNMASFFPEAQMLPESLVFPLQVRLINNHLFVIDPLNNKNKVTIKDEIVMINGRSASAVIKNIYNHVPSQGQIETTKNHYFNAWATCMIPYSLGFPDTYEIVLKGAQTPILLNKAEMFRAQFSDPYERTCAENLCLQFIDDRTAVLTISSFNYYPGANLSEFEGFIDNSFIEIESKNIKNLIIDLRYNDGGSAESSIHLLKYLSDKSFTYYSNVQYEGKQGKIYGEDVLEPFKNGFEGKQYYLIDGLGNSTTGHFMSLVKVLKLGTIIGEELGSNQFCSAGQIACRLSNTKLKYSIANNTHETTATSLPDERGILPHHIVVQNIDEYFNGKDTVKAYVLGLIGK